MNQALVLAPLLLLHHYVQSFSVCTSDVYVHILFPPLFLPFCLKHVHESLLFMLCCLPFWKCSAWHEECSIVVSVFQRRKSVSALPREWLIFPGFVFSPIYFSRVTLRLPSPSFPLGPSVLSSLRSSDFFLSPLCFHLFSPLLLSSLFIWEYVWQKSSLGATLPLSCEDQWWH